MSEKTIIAGMIFCILMLLAITAFTLKALTLPIDPSIQSKEACAGNGVWLHTWGANGRCAVYPKDKGNHNASAKGDAQ